MSARFGLRALQRASPFTRQQVNLRMVQRRTYAVENPVENAMPKQSGVGAFWNSSVGPKTVHFWAPIMKWGLVLAGAADFARPASQLSLTQNAALMATGLIWTRWCFVIKPRNLFLASVNFLLFCVGSAQVTRVLMYQQSIKGDTVGDELKKAAKEEVAAVEKIVENPKAAIKSITNPK